MNIEDLISQYLDGSLSSEAEADLHHRLAVSPEARQLFRSHIMLRGIARDQRVLHVPTTETRARLFDRLVKEEGMQLPPVASAPVSASVAPQAVPESPRPAPIPSAAARRTGKSDHRRRRVLPWLIPSLVASMMFVVILNTSWIDNLSAPPEPAITSYRNPETSQGTAVKPGAPDMERPSPDAPAASGTSTNAPESSASTANAVPRDIPSVSAPSASAPPVSAQSSSMKTAKSSPPRDAGNSMAAANAADSRNGQMPNGSIGTSAPERSMAANARASEMKALQSRATLSNNANSEEFKPRTFSRDIAEDASGRMNNLLPAANSLGNTVSDAHAYGADDEAKQENQRLGEQSAMAMSAEGGGDGLDYAVNMALDSAGLGNRELYGNTLDATPLLARHRVDSDDLSNKDNGVRAESAIRLMNMQTNSHSGPQQSQSGFNEVNASVPPPASAADGAAANLAMEPSSYSSMNKLMLDTVAAQSLSMQLRSSAATSLASPVVQADMGRETVTIASLADSVPATAEWKREGTGMSIPSLHAAQSPAPLTAVVGLQQNSLASLERSSTQMQVLIRAGVEFGKGDHLIFGVISGGHYRENTTEKLIGVMYDGQLFPSEAVTSTGEPARTISSEAEQNEVWGGGGYRFSRQIAEGWRVGVGVWTGAGNRYIRVATEVPVTYQPVRWIRIEFLPMVQYTAAHGETTRTTVTSFDPALRYSEKVERTWVLEFDKELNLGIGIGASVLW